MPPAPTKSDNPVVEEKPTLPAIFEPVELAAFDIPRNLDAVALSPDGQLLATGATFPMEFTNDFKTLPKDPSEPVLRLWQVKTGKAAAILHGHREDVRALAFAPDGSTLVSGGFDSTVRVWDVSTLGGSKK